MSSAPEYADEVAAAAINPGWPAASATIGADNLRLAGLVTIARDLWTHEVVRFTNGIYSTIVPMHAASTLSTLQCRRRS
jgi:hypothetical protein